MGTRGVARAAASGAPEFFGVLPLMAVGLFALNNFVLKRAWPGLVTGKLSDLLICFFLPLFVSALMQRISRLGNSDLKCLARPASESPEVYDRALNAA